MVTQAEIDRVWVERGRLLAERDPATIEAEIMRLVPDAPWDGKMLVFPAT